VHTLEDPSDLAWPFEQAPNRRQQKRPTAGLRENDIAARVERGRLDPIRRIARYNHDTDVVCRRLGAQSAAEIQAVHDRHLNVGHDDLRNCAAHLIQRQPSVPGRRDIQSTTAQETRMQIADIGYVVDDKNSRSRPR
jgi:hypothetical protein